MIYDPQTLPVLFVTFVVMMLAFYKCLNIAWHRGYRARRRQDAIRKLS